MHIVIRYISLNLLIVQHMFLSSKHLLSNHNDQVSAAPDIFTVKENLRSIDAITVPLDQEYTEPSTLDDTNEVSYTNFSLYGS